MEELFDNIRRYGTFVAEFGCTNDLGMAIRVRVAEYDSKKYFIVQCNGIIAELFEICIYEDKHHDIYIQSLL